MYIEIYDRNNKHLGNVYDIKYDITKRIYDFDTSTFSGICECNVKYGFLFVLTTNDNRDIYSGYIKSLTQQDNRVSFKGVDFKTILDIELLLDFTNMERDNYPDTLGKMIDFIWNNEKYVEYRNVTPLTIEFIHWFTPMRDIDIGIFGDFFRGYQVINVNSYLKNIFAFFGYYIDVSIYENRNGVIFNLLPHQNKGSILLQDFTFERNLTDIGTNKTMATIKYEMKEPIKVWNKTNRQTYENTPIGLREVVVYTNENQTFDKDPDSYELFTAFYVAWEINGNIDLNSIEYYVLVPTYDTRPQLPEVHYWLTTDNQIYEGEAPTWLKSYPVKQKIFEAEFLAEAQYNAVSELVDNRYNENIILSKNGSGELLDFDSVKLGDIYMVYEKDDEIKENGEWITIFDTPTNVVKNQKFQITSDTTEHIRATYYGVVEETNIDTKTFTIAEDNTLHNVPDNTDFSNSSIYVNDELVYENNTLVEQHFYVQFNNTNSGQLIWLENVRDGGLFILFDRANTPAETNVGKQYNNLGTVRIETGNIVQEYKITSSTSTSNNLLLRFMQYQSNNHAVYGEFLISKDIGVNNDKIKINGLEERGSPGMWQPQLLKLEYWKRKESNWEINISKELPVSEIQLNNDDTRIKLGFKKTLLTEIIKGK